MSDNEIRRILVQRKRIEAQEERRDHIINAIETFFSIGGMIVIGFMLSVIGG
jgi:hypothetical protein